MILKAALVLVIHGGGFIGGSSHDVYAAQTVAALRQQHIAAISVSYRLGNPVLAEHDLVRITRRYRKRRVYAIGYSAGGGLAEWLAEHGQIRAAVGVAPLSDLRGWTCYGCVIPWSSSTAATASPLLHVTRQATPLLILHGDQDNMVSLSQSRAIHARYRRSTLVTVLGATHQSLTSHVSVQGVRWLVRQIKS